MLKQLLEDYGEEIFTSINKILHETVRVIFKNSKIIKWIIQDKFQSTHLWDLIFYLDESKTDAY